MQGQSTMYGTETTEGLVSSLRDLEYRVAVAAAEGVKELETTPELMSLLLKEQYKKGERSIVYKNVRLFEQGTRENTLAVEGETISQRLHGHTRLKY